MSTEADLPTNTQTGASEPSLDPLTERVLALRRDRANRSALRRAGHRRTRYYAVPLIGGFVGRGPEDPAYRFAAICAAFDGVSNTSRMPLGRTLRLNDPKRGDPEGPVARRLFVIQRQPLALADSTIRSLLRITEPSSLDWNALLWMLRGWDQRDLNRRVAVRERLLRDFYTFVPTDSDVPTDSETATPTPETRNR